MIGKVLILSFLLLGMTGFNANSQKRLLRMENFREPAGDWFEAGDTRLDPADERKLEPIAGEGVFINGKAGKIVNFVTRETHGDVKLELEFMISEKSNSGVYLQGRYEIQIFDSWGKENPVSWDCGGIYARYDGTKTYEGVRPLVNASKEPGEWQHLFISFRAPRFNKQGEKIKNAVFKEVKLNGVTVHKNVEVTGPTASSLDNNEEPLGPLMLQGDHGPVAYRNSKLKKQ
jgi:hypothetical protein